jgi:anti-anti-sigma factor
MLDRELTYSSTAGTKDGVVVLTLDGPLTLSNMFGFQHDLRAMTPACLILDLTGVPYMDSAGLGVLMNYYVSSQNNHRSFLVAGVNDRVRALLEMTRVDQILKIYGSVDEAEAAGLA